MVKDPQPEQWYWSCARSMEAECYGSDGEPPKEPWCGVLRVSPEGGLRLHHSPNDDDANSKAVVTNRMLFATEQEALEDYLDHLKLHEEWLARERERVRVLRGDALARLNHLKAI